MAKITIQIRLESLNNKIIKITVDPSKPIEDAIEKIIENPQINLSRKNDGGITLSYGLWFGNDNIAINNKTFADANIEEGDILSMGELIGENENPTEQKFSFLKKITKKQATYISVGFISVLTIIIILTNWSSIFPKTEKINYIKKDFIKQYIGNITIGGIDKMLKMNIKEIGDDWVVTYDLYIDKKPSLANKHAKIEPLNNTIIFYEETGDNKQEIGIINKLSKGKLQKTATGKIEIISEYKWSLIQF